MNEDHRSLLARWLAEPHVREWWGEPARQLEKIFSGRPRSQVDGYIAFVADRPVGYIQSWSVLDFDEPFKDDIPAGTLGIDIFIGESDTVGKGIGQRIVSAFAERLLAAGARHLVMDPKTNNERAIAAYRKAGFARAGEYPSDHPDDGITLLMQRAAESNETLP